MAHSRGRTHRGPARGVARIPEWASVNLFDTTVPASGRVLLGSLNAAALALRPFTIVRTRLVISWESDQVSASESPQGAFGMGVVKSPAIAIGVTAVPTPLTEATADYFVYQSLIDSFLFATAAGFESQGGRQYIVDSKAMRKVGLDEDVAVTVEEGNAVGAVISVMGRFLAKLH